MFGIENGLWEKSIFFSSSFHSYMGKSTIQHSSNRSLSIKPRSSAIFVRALPANLKKRLRLAGDKEHGVAVAQSRVEPATSPFASGPRLLATGPRPMTAPASTA